MKFSRIYAIFLRQLFLIKSSPVRLTPIFLWIVIDVIQWGFISKYLGSLGRATFGFVTVVLGAIILWGFLTRLSHGVMTAFLEDIWAQNFLNYFASPLKIGEYLLGLVLTSIFTGTLGLSAMVIVAGAAFGYNFFKIGLLLLPFMIILFIFGISLGVMINGIIFRFGPAAEWIGWPIPVVLSIFSGVYYPVATLPAGLQVIAKLLPASYVFESLRAILSGGTGDPSLFFNLLMSLGLSSVYFILIYKFFVSVYRHNMKTGSIARFAAEPN